MLPPVVALVQARSIATRTRLLEAAIDVLVKHGYAGTSTVEVCKRAKTSRGAHLHHFPTKAELLAAAVEHLFARRLTELRDELLPLVDRRRRLSAAIAAMWRIYSGPTLAAWMELAIAARTDPQLRKQVATVERAFFAHAQAAFVELLGGDGISPARAAALTRMLLSTFDGLALHHVVAPADDPTPVLAEAERVLTAVLQEKER
jgi:AcrR family transcriptional regulator